MPHTSKTKLKPEHYEKLYKELRLSFERAVHKNHLHKVLDQFFTKTEKEMFSKRLAVIALLSKNASIPTVSDALSMSPTTIDKMSLKSERGDYDEIVSHALGKKDIWDILEKIFTVGGIMPAKVGKSRWDKLNKDFKK